MCDIYLPAILYSLLCNNFVLFLAHFRFTQVSSILISYICNQKLRFMSASSTKAVYGGGSETDSNRSDADDDASIKAVYGGSEIDAHSCNDSPSISSMSTFEYDSEEEGNNNDSHPLVSSDSDRSISNAFSESEYSSPLSFIESSISGLGSISSFDARSNVDAGENEIFRWLAKNEAARMNGLDSDDTSLDSDDDAVIK